MAQQELPREVLQAVLQLFRHQNGVGLSETELRERLNRLQELHILPEHRDQDRVASDGDGKSPSDEEVKGEK